MEQASAEGMLPALCQRLAQIRYGCRIPDDITKLLSTAELLNAERNEVILTEAALAATLLNQVGSVPVALKGLAYLITGVYPRLGARYLLDIDMLLASNAIPLAAGQLRSCGYRELEAVDFIGFRHHVPALSRPGMPQIELHHRVGQGICPRLLPSPKILADAKPTTFKGATFLIPSPTDLVNHLIIHSQLHHPYYDRVFPPLRALVDLAQLQSRFPDEIDWNALVKTYRENGEFATLILHIHQAHQILGFAIPDPIPVKLPAPLRIRLQRRTILNRNPSLRFFDPIYILMSLFSRRLRLLPFILRTPSSWLDLFRLLIRPNFYRNLIG